MNNVALVSRASQIHNFSISLLSFFCTVPLLSLPFFSPHLLTVYLFVQFSSVAQSCLTLCDPMDCSTPGLPVHHQLLELPQTHAHWVSDAIQPPLCASSLSPPLVTSCMYLIPSGFLCFCLWSYVIIEVIPSNLAHPFLIFLFFQFYLDLWL